MDKGCIKEPALFRKISLLGHALYTWLYDEDFREMLRTSVIVILVACYISLVSCICERS